MTFCNDTMSSRFFRVAMKIVFHITLMVYLSYDGDMEFATSTEGYDLCWRL